MEVSGNPQHLSPFIIEAPLTFVYHAAEKEGLFVDSLSLDGARKGAFRIHSVKNDILWTCAIAYHIFIAKEILMWSIRCPKPFKMSTLSWQAERWYKKFDHPKQRGYQDFIPASLFTHHIPPASLKFATNCLITSPFQRAGLTNNPCNVSSKPNPAIPSKKTSSLANGS